MLKLLEKFSQAVNNTISGRSIDHLTDTIHSSVLLGSAFIRKVFSDFAAEIESEVHHIGERYRDETILKLIRASPGYNLPGFDSFDAFSHLVLKHHKKLKEPCLSMVDVVIDHIREEIIPNSLSRIMAFDTYPDLKEAVKEAAMDLVADTGAAARRRVDDYLATLEYVHSSDQEQYVEVMSFREIVEESVQHVCTKLCSAQEAMNAKQQGKNLLINRDEDDVKPMRQKMLSYDKLVRRSL